MSYWREGFSSGNTEILSAAALCQGGKCEKINCFSGCLLSKRGLGKKTCCVNSSSLESLPEIDSSGCCIMLLSYAFFQLEILSEITEIAAVPLAVGTV